MVDYRKILYYYSKGNNNSQIAVICGYSRKTIIKVISRVKEINLSVSDSQGMKNWELKKLLFPVRQEETEYLLVDFKWECFQMVKHQSSIRLCWRRYCKRALRAGKKAYCFSMYFRQYKEYKKFISDSMTAMEVQWFKLRFTVSYYKDGNQQLYPKALLEKQAWLDKYHLNETKL